MNRQSRTGVVGLMLAVMVAGGCAAPRTEPPPPPKGAPVTAPPAPASTPAATATVPAPTPAPAAPPSVPTAREVFPGVRLDLTNRVVEFDGEVVINAHDEATPRVYLEVMVCSPDTREHESLVITRARASHVHAALLMLGLEPGSPGRFDWSGKEVRPIAPSGPAVSVLFRTAGPDGAPVEHDPWSWVSIVRGGEVLDARPEGRFVFAGSRFARRADPESGKGVEVYDADGAGTLVGLTTFGSETIAWSTAWSPDSALQQPEWIARAATTPKIGTRVTVVVRAQ